jgi:TatD DNase family protein
MSWLTDAHVHLSDDEFSKDLPFIINCMNKLRIKACCVSVDLQSSKKTLELGKKSKLILPFIGIHPEKASSNDLSSVVNLIEENSKYISGVGEIGLDKTYVSDEIGFKNQELAFHKMLSLAEKLKKPVSIHSRATLEEILSILPSYSISGILLHWFAGSKKQLKTVMEREYFVSYGPTILYAKDKQILLSESSAERILVETDGPVKFSRCFGFKVGQIAFLPSVVFCVAKVLHTTYDDILIQIEQNCKHYLGV